MKLKVISIVTFLVIAASASYVPPYYEVSFRHIEVTQRKGISLMTFLVITASASYVPHYYEVSLGHLI
jgi:hypothetical protein